MWNKDNIIPIYIRQSDAMTKLLLDCVSEESICKSGSFGLQVIKGETGIIKTN